MRYDRILTKDAFFQALDKISNDLYVHAPAYCLKSIAIQNKDSLDTYWHIVQHNFSKDALKDYNLIIDQGNIAYCHQFPNGDIHYYLFDIYPISKAEND
jgi:hypothetical protein